MHTNRTIVLGLFFFFAVLGGNLLAQPAAPPQMPKSWEEPLPSGPINDDYPPHPDMLPQADVPKGKAFAFTFKDSKIFSGTRRIVKVYIPAQYKADKPACVHVHLDNFGWETMFDNLIHKGDMPITIGVGLSPGAFDFPNEEKPQRSNRSLEFDGLSDDLARHIIEEIFPAIEERKTPDDLPIRLSRDPNDHSVGGGSTGGIGAFTLAWERPDLFRRVFSVSGTFVGMRGGDRYPVLVRKTEPKPIRVFLQDGIHDQWLGGPEVGDWWVGNLALKRALEFSGYDVNWAWGTGPHGSRQGGAVAPDAFRWLWRNWPEPITANSEKSLNVLMKRILKPGEDWNLVTDKLKKPGYLTANGAAEIFCRDAETAAIYRIGEDGTLTKIIESPGGDGPITFDETGRLYAADTAKKAVYVVDLKSEEKKWTAAFDGIAAASIVAFKSGEIYVTDKAAGTLWLIKPDGSKTLLADDLQGPTGISAGPGQSPLWLTVIESKSHWGKTYRIRQDGTLEFGQRYYWLHVPDRADDVGNGAGVMAGGGLFVATRLGIMVVGGGGNTQVILPLPLRGGQAEATSLSFGGKGFGTLYAIADGVIFKRNTLTNGAPPLKCNNVTPVDKK